MNSYRKDVKAFLEKKYFVLFVLVIAVIGYGFELTNLSVNIDNLAGVIYHGSGNQMLKSGRFGMTFWSKLFCVDTYLTECSYAIGIISLLMLIWAAINFCILFKRASKDKISMTAYTIFTAFLISYPLINEIWMYYGARITVCGNFLFVSFSLLLIESQIRNKKFNLLSSLAIGFFMCIVCSGYESLVAVYIFVVFSILFLQEYTSPNWKKHLKQGFIYLIPLLSGIALRIIVHKIILVLFHFEKATNGATKIQWFTSEPLLSTIKSLFYGIGVSHIYRALFYLPIAIFLICLLIAGVYFIYLLCKKKVFLSLLVLGMMFSLEIMSIIQGSSSPYRTCQVFAVFVSFTAMLIANKFKYKQIVPLLLCFVCIQQAVYLNYIFTLNQMKYEEEKVVINKIGIDIEKNNSQSKNIVFVGEYSKSDYVENQLLVKNDSCEYRLTETLFNKSIDWKFPSTNVNSVISWSVNAFNKEYECEMKYRAQTMMEYLFNFHGFDIHCIKDYANNKEKYSDYIKNNNIPCYPHDGYIVETDEVVIVNLGE